MMRAILMALLLTGCAGHQVVEVGAYQHIKPLVGENTWETGGSPIAVFKVRHEMERGACEYMHVSNWMTGFPFNDEHESTVDMVGCAYRWRVR